VETFYGNEKLRNFFYPVSTNVDAKNKEFISSIEGKEYPIYGV
jgi:hypothetical protein